MTMTEFLLARIREDYATERGAAEIGSTQEFSARLRANTRMLSAGGALVVMGDQVVSYSAAEAAKYADHPDYREEWRL
jgi:hypothetical protein